MSNNEYSRSNLPRCKRIDVFNLPIGRSYTYSEQNFVQYTPEEAEAFRAKIDLIREYSPGPPIVSPNETGNFPIGRQFYCPNVEVELVYGIYKFKCLYHTAL